MRFVALTALATLSLLTACNPAPIDGNTLAEANATGAEAGDAIENAAASAPGAPLEKEAALVLMKERHENYEKIGDAMKLLGRELKAETPDLAKVREAAATINTLAPQIPGWFPAGTGPDVGKTDALAEIWQKPDDFASKAKDFQAAARAFNAAAQGSDLAAIRAAHGNLGRSCKACHDIYRAKDD